MDSFMDKTRDFVQKLTPNQRIALVVTPIVLLVIIIIVAIIVNTPHYKVEIEFPEKTNIPSAELGEVKETLYSTIKSNTPNFDEKQTFYGVARDYTETRNGTTTNASFLVDFDELKQSYAITVTWPQSSSDERVVSVLCAGAKSKYPDTKCITEGNSSDYILDILPHSGKTASGQTYNLVRKFYQGGFYLEIQVNSCGDAKIVEAAISAAKAWINSNPGLDADDYLYYAPTNKCDLEHDSVSAAQNYVQASTSKTNDTNVNKNLPYFKPGLYKVYPETNDAGDVTSIQVDITGCTDSQTDGMEDTINNYLKSHNINYPTTYNYCVN